MYRPTVVYNLNNIPGTREDVLSGISPVRTILLQAILISPKIRQDLQQNKLNIGNT